MSHSTYGCVHCSAWPVEMTLDTASTRCSCGHGTAPWASVEALAGRGTLGPSPAIVRLNRRGIEAMLDDPSASTA